KEPDLPGRGWAQLQDERVQCDGPRPGIPTGPATLTIEPEMGLRPARSAGARRLVGRWRRPVHGPFAEALQPPAIAAVDQLVSQVGRHARIIGENRSIGGDVRSAMRRNRPLVLALLAPVVLVAVACVQGPGATQSPLAPSPATPVSAAPAASGAFESMA